MNNIAIVHKRKEIGDLNHLCTLVNCIYNGHHSCYVIRVDTLVYSPSFLDKSNYLCLHVPNRICPMAKVTVQCRHYHAKIKIASIKCLLV